MAEEVEACYEEEEKRTIEGEVRIYSIRSRVGCSFDLHPLVSMEKVPSRDEVAILPNARSCGLLQSSFTQVPSSYVPSQKMVVGSVGFRFTALGGH